MVPRDQIADIVREMCGPMAQGVQTPVYKKPYPEWVDRVHEYPRGFRIPDFALFYGNGNQSIVEHIARFATQCGEFTNNDYMKLRLFLNSLTGPVFVWYINLIPGSIQTWQQIEEAFHAQFFETEPEVSIANLTRLSQRLDKKAAQFITRFKRARNKCRVILPEPELVLLALVDINMIREDGPSQGLDDLAELEKDLDNLQFFNEQDQGDVQIGWFNLNGSTNNSGWLSDELDKEE